MSISLARLAVKNEPSLSVPYLPSVAEQKMLLVVPSIGNQSGPCHPSTGPALCKEILGLWRLYHGVMTSFLNFIREQGVVGLAIGFILGGAVSELVKSFITNIVNPVVGLLLGSVEGLSSASFSLFGATVAWGGFVTAFINFIIIAAVVYYGFKVLGLDKLDKKKA